MKYYASHNKQLSLDLFRSSLEGLDKSNRWVSMGDLLPWPELEREYNSRLNNSDKGAGRKTNAENQETGMRTTVRALALRLPKTPMMLNTLPPAV